MTSIDRVLGTRELLHRVVRSSPPLGHATERRRTSVVAVLFAYIRLPPKAGRVLRPLAVYC